MTLWVRMHEDYWVDLLRCAGLNRTGCALLNWAAGIITGFHLDQITRFVMVCYISLLVPLFWCETAPSCHYFSLFMGDCTCFAWHDLNFYTCTRLQLQLHPPPKKKKTWRFLLHFTIWHRTPRPSTNKNNLKHHATNYTVLFLRTHRQKPTHNHPCFPIFRDPGSPSENGHGT